MEINGHKGIYLLKSEPHFVTQAECFEAIDTFMNYYLLRTQGMSYSAPLFSLTEKDTELMDKLKSEGYSTWNDWKSDYFYYVQK